MQIITGKTYAYAHILRRIGCHWHTINKYWYCSDLIKLPDLPGIIVRRYTEKI